ncbi:MAG: hypothetical protein AAF600_10910 [Bacteroidota bacterium]
MANQRLTDLTEKTSGVSVNDILHLIDTDDTSQNAAGSSFKINLLNLFKNVSVVSILGALVYKPTSTGTGIENTDWVIYMNSTRLTIGLATDNMTSLPADLDDSTKFSKFYDQDGPLLP